MCCEVLGRSGPSLQSGGHPCLVHAIFPCLSPSEGKISNVSAAPPPYSQNAPVITLTASKCCKWLNRHNKNIAERFPILIFPRSFFFFSEMSASSARSQYHAHVPEEEGDFESPRQIARAAHPTSMSVRPSKLNLSCLAGRSPPPPPHLLFCRYKTSRRLNKAAGLQCDLQEMLAGDIKVRVCALLPLNPHSASPRHLRGVALLTRW